MSDHQVFGDWRDLRGAIALADKGWSARSNDERTMLWDFAERVLANYAPLRARCGPFGCGTVVPYSQAYRCADCRGVYCEACIRPHFGAQHQPHPPRQMAAAHPTDQEGQNR